MDRPENVIDLSSPKHKRTTRGNEVRNCALLSSGNYPSYESVNVEPSLETSATTTLHECPIITDPELKHAKLCARLPLTSEIPVIPKHVDPLPNDQTPSTLFTAIAFQQKLFGHVFELL